MKTRGEQTAADALETNKGSIIYHALHSGNLTVEVERWVAEYGGGGNGGFKTGPKRGPSANAGHGGGGGAGGGKLYGGLAGFEAGDYVLKHFKPYNRARNSVAQYGNSVIKEGAVHFARNAIGQMARAAQTVEEGLTQTWQNGRTGLSLFGRQAVQTVRQAGPAATAIFAGGAAALKTGPWPQEKPCWVPPSRPEAQWLPAAPPSGPASTSPAPAITSEPPSWANILLMTG